MEHEGEAVPLGFGGGVAGPVRPVCPGSAGLYPAHGGAGLRPVLCLGGGRRLRRAGSFPIRAGPCSSRRGRKAGAGSERRRRLHRFGLSRPDHLLLPGAGRAAGRSHTPDRCGGQRHRRFPDDDVPLYADFDREKAAIGALRLPTLDAYRTEPVTISRPWTTGAGR